MAESTVRLDAQAQEAIVGSAGHDAHADQGGGPEGRGLFSHDDQTVPTLSVAGLSRSTTAGSRPQRSRGYMTVHALEATGGLTYAQMPQYATADGKGTSDKGAGPSRIRAAHRSSQPRAPGLDQPRRRSPRRSTPATWPSRSRSSGIVVGFALLLSGIGFAILAVGGTLRDAEPAFRLFGKRRPKVGAAFPRPRRPRLIGGHAAPTGRNDAGGTGGTPPTPPASRRLRCRLSSAPTSAVQNAQRRARPGCRTGTRGTSAGVPLPSWGVARSSAATGLMTRK